jgi:predicted MFS family arabinose efflux permease
LRCVGNPPWLEKLKWEAEWSEALAVTACFDAMRADRPRIGTHIKIDYREGKSGRLRSKIEVGAGQARAAARALITPPKADDRKANTMSSNRCADATPAAPNNASRWLGVVALLILVAISYVDRVNASVLITDRAFTDHFGISGDRVLQGALMTTFLVGYGIAAFFLTPFYEALLGVRRGLFVSIAAWAVFTLASPYALGATMLLVLRFVLGASEGPLFSLKTMYIRQHFANHEVGKPNAVSSMGVSGGLAIGIPLVTWLVYSFDWHSSFVALALLNALVGLPLIWFFIDRPVRDASPAAERRHTPRHHSVGETIRLALSTPSLGAILLIEIATLAYLWGSSSWLPSFLLQAQHFSIRNMGIVAALPFLTGVAAGFLGGYFVDKLAPQRVPLVFVVGVLGTGVSVLLLLASQATGAVAFWLIASQAFWGLQGSAIPTLVQHKAPKVAVGSTYGLVNGVGNLVSAFMPLAMGAAIGAGATTRAGFAAGFGLLAGTQLVTLCVALYLLYRGRAPGAAVTALPASA